MFTIINTKVYSKLDIVKLISISNQEFESTMSELKSYAKKIDGYFNLNLTYKVDYLKHYLKPLIGFDMDDIDEKYFEWYTKVCEAAQDIYDILLSNPFSKH
jgi:hypothetical protein